MLAFIAWTPLHIINILNTKQSYFKNKKADMYIYDEFNGAKNIYQNLLKENIFENVYLVSPSKMGNSFISKFNVLFNINIMVNKELKMNYDIIFIQGGNYFSKILFGITKKNNPNVKLHYIEDGLAAYLGNNLLNISRFRKKLLNLINPYSLVSVDIEKYYLYEPNLSNINEKSKLEKIPTIDKDGELTKILRRIFNVSKKVKAINNTLIFLDAPLEKDGWKVDEKKVFNTVKEFDDMYNLIVKMHPRSKVDKYEDDVKILKTSLPWELCFLEFDITNSHIISILSTASFSPQMMFETENSVILMSEFVYNDKEGHRMDKRTLEVLEQVKDFAERYQTVTGNNVSIPKKLSDFKEILRSK